MKFFENRWKIIHRDESFCRCLPSNYMNVVKQTPKHPAKNSISPSNSRIVNVLSPRAPPPPPPPPPAASPPPPLAWHQKNHKLRNNVIMTRKQICEKFSFTHDWIKYSPEISFCFLAFYIDSSPFVFEFSLSCFGLYEGLRLNNDLSKSKPTWHRTKPSLTS